MGLKQKQITATDKFINELQKLIGSRITQIDLWYKDGIIRMEFRDREGIQVDIKKGLIEIFKEDKLIQIKIF